MGNKESKEEKKIKNEVVLEDVKQAEVYHFEEALRCVSEYLQEISKNKTTDASKSSNNSKMTNKLKSLLISTITRGLLYPSWIEHKQEDEALNDKIRSFYWVTPEILEFKVDLEEYLKDINVVAAIRQLKLMTDKEDPFWKLSCVFKCCEHTMDSLKKNSGADELLTALIFIIIKSNPPQLYTNMAYISAFLETNNHLNQDTRVNPAVPRLYNTVLDCCFTNLQIAVTTIKGMQASELTKTVIYEKTEYSYIQGKYEEAVSEEFRKSLVQNFGELETGLKHLIKVRQLLCDKHKTDMETIAKTLDEHKQNVNITKAVGSFFAVAGGTVGVVGFGLMFTTLGVSAVLIPVGAAISGAGGGIASIASFVEYGINRSKAMEIKAMREEYEKALTEVFLALKKIEKTVFNAKEFYQNIAVAGKTLISFVDVIMKLVRIGFVVQDAADIGVSAFRTASSAGRGLAIAGVVISAVLLPIDMIFFGISINSLVKGEKAKQANEIRAWINQELPNNDEIKNTVAKLLDGVLNFVKEIRSTAGQNDKTSLDECENHLMKCFQEVEELISLNKKQ